jgi:hypothetical protein
LIKRIIVWIILIILLTFYVSSCSNSLSKKFTNARYSDNSWFSWDKYHYGDLFGLSFLPDFKFPVSEEPLNVSKTVYHFPKIIDLYVVHDSYLATYLNCDTNFYGISRIVHKELWGNQIQARLDTSHINILLFETAERYFRDYSDSNNLKQQLNMLENDPKLNTEAGNTSKQTNILNDFFSMLFNPQTDQNLQFNTFDYNFITPIRECKAQINYKLFGRVCKEVVVSTDKEYLFYAETIDTAFHTSSYSPLTEEELQSYIASLNATWSFYKKAGFDEVIFTIIPNPVSVLGTDKNKYNGLIPRIAANPMLKMPVIDVYDIFCQAPYRVYYRTDTHWNKNGFTLWQNEFHKKVQEIVQRNKK